MTKHVLISLFHKVLTFIDLHDLLIIIMFLCINLQKNLRFGAKRLKIDRIFTKILPIMFSCSNALGSAIQYTPYPKIPYKYFFIPQFDCTHYLGLY